MLNYMYCIFSFCIGTEPQPVLKPRPAPPSFASRVAQLQNEEQQRRKKECPQDSTEDKEPAHQIVLKVYNALNDDERAEFNELMSQYRENRRKQREISSYEISDEIDDERVHEIIDYLNTQALTHLAVDNTRIAQDTASLFGLTDPGAPGRIERIILGNEVLWRNLNGTGNSLQAYTDLDPENHAHAPHHKNP